jgi:hypothetical protein
MAKRAKRLEVDVEIEPVAAPATYTLGQVFLISIGTTVAGGIILWLVKQALKPAKAKNRGIARVVPLPRNPDDE